MHKSLTMLSVLAAAYSLCQCDASAAQTTVTWDSGSHTLLDGNAGSPLTGGAPTTPSDGAILELGYYSTATVGNYFSGSFIPLTGLGTLNTAYAGTTIGDDFNQSAGDGTFALTSVFTIGDVTTGNSLPVAGTPLAIKFYNTTTVTPSSLFNVASDAAWVWQTPNDGALAPVIAVTLDAPLLQWLGGPTTAFYTSQSAVPEPSTVVFVVAAGAGLLVLAKRRKAVLTA